MLSLISINPQNETRGHFSSCTGIPCASIYCCFQKWPYATKSSLKVCIATSSVMNFLGTAKLLMITP